MTFDHSRYLKYPEEGMECSNSCCKRIIMPPYKHCEACRVNSRRYQHSIRALRIAEGYCARCGLPNPYPKVSATGKILAECGSCRVYMARVTAKRRKAALGEKVK